MGGLLKGIVLSVLPLSELRGGNSFSQYRGMHALSHCLVF